MDILIRPGDSLWYFSDLFKIPLQLLLDSNRNINPQHLQVGQRIQIPGYVTTSYTITQGDSLWQIAQNKNLPLNAILLVNPEIQPSRLHIGQTIQVPQRLTWRLVNGQQNYDYSMMMNDIKKLQTAYPFLQSTSIGNSVLAQPIPEILIGNGSKRIHYNGSFHANEWITTPTIMTFLNDYLLALTNQTTIRGLSMGPLYNQTTLSLVPMVNPDGVNLVINGPPANEALKNKLIAWNHNSQNFSGWKANINGVDLNDQFPAKWELENARNPQTPGPRDYGGEAPLTQPEAIAMADLTRNSHFAWVLAFHTQGRVIYWGFENLEPPESQTMVEEFSRVSGYEPIQSANSYAGYKDWFIQDWRRPGFTVELGSGTNPLPISQFDTIYQEALGIFLAGLYL
ncbi:LysM peptidoglycan-binding domain-containing protein [Lysinibacillus sphaericus]|uniref:Gamma-D-glutamyl-L-diamino acid endopeptidase I n=2 Tax=Lysinibacillus TaxID=400634 RepID=A0A2S0JUZ6_LYSSH|nr:MULTISPECIES: M14 family metallopeptidase [Lysinibacillus]AHN23826.1 peptidase M14 [Lysinibacillus varians]AVK94911.1 peptidase M14 [Lysinibacillus sphaericus]MED4544190.1 M14 family metallopeptidase [Lysinibacillus sphaericus]TKI17124.1 LysM peptidoglycan-binding domain-containing protein [Lysinibacillus sphaericus]TKI65751.1 LysM peptidoglycan-binding domain-containing protein [Lysinibacillus varians]